jgi:hypothetical protein
MAKFDIASEAMGPKPHGKQTTRLEAPRSVYARILSGYEVQVHLVTTRNWGMPSPAPLVLAILITNGIAAADPVVGFVPTQTSPDPPVRPPPEPSPVLPPTWDLDGLYLWLGPIGAVGREAAVWDSTFGGDLALVRVREREPLGALGLTVGASKWTTHDGGRIWLDGLVGTEPVGHVMVGLTAGALLELDQISAPRIGGTVGLWAYDAIAPYVRVGYIDDLGGFVEFGLHIPLPVYRHGDGVH